MFTCTVFQNTFLLFAFYSSSFFFSSFFLIYFSPILPPDLCTLCPDSFPFCCFIASSADVTSTTTQVTWSECAVKTGCGQLAVVVASSILKTVILSKRERHNFSKWTNEHLLGIKTTVVKCPKTLRWPKWSRYIYDSALSARNLSRSRPCCQGKLFVLNLTGALEGTL